MSVRTSGIAVRPINPFSAIVSEYGWTVQEDKGSGGAANTFRSWGWNVQAGGGDTAYFTIIDGDGNRVIRVHKGMPCLALSGDAAGPDYRADLIGDLRLHPNLGQLQASTARVIEARRVYWDTFMLARAGTHANGITGLSYRVQAGSTAGALFVGPPPSSASNGFGIVTNASGGWSYRARLTLGGALVDDVPLEWPVATDEWAIVDVVIKSAGVSPAELSILLNGERVVTRQWGSTPQRLPEYDAVTNGATFDRAIHAGGTDTGVLYLAAARHRVGVLEP